MKNSSKNLNEVSTIHNVRFETQFTITHNLTPENPNLSWAAKGLLWYILSRPKNWSIHSSHLAKIYRGNTRGNGKEAISSMLRELKNEGYVIYTKSHLPDGRWAHRYDIYPMKIVDFQKMFPEQVETLLVQTAQVQPAILTNKDKEQERIITNTEVIIATPEKSKPKPSSPKVKPAGGNNKIPEELKILEDITLKQKEQIAKYPIEVVRDAIRYCYHEKTKLEGENARIKQLHAFCKNPEGYSKALKDLEKPREKKSIRERILDRFKKGEMYNGLEFSMDDNGPYFIHPIGHVYSIKWNDKEFEINWLSLLKKLGIND